MMRKVFANVARRNYAGFTGLSYVKTTKPYRRPSRIDNHNETKSNAVLLLRNTVVDRAEILSVDFELIPDEMHMG